MLTQLNISPVNLAIIDYLFDFNLANLKMMPKPCSHISKLKICLCIFLRMYLFVDAGEMSNEFSAVVTELSRLET